MFQNGTSDRVILELKIRHPDLAYAYELDQESGRPLTPGERGDSPHELKRRAAWIGEYQRGSAISVDEL